MKCYDLETITIYKKNEAKVVESRRARQTVAKYFENHNFLRNQLTPAIILRKNRTTLKKVLILYEHSTSMKIICVYLQHVLKQTDFREPRWQH